MDVNPGDGVAEDAGGATTLRAAVMEANALDGDDSINLSVATYPLLISGAGEQAAASGDLDVTDSNDRLTIIGAGSTATIISGNESSRVFQVMGGAILRLESLQVTGGDQPSLSGDSYGGGIRNNIDGTLEIENSLITDNEAKGGGGIYNQGSATITNSILSDNSTPFAGGAIDNTGLLTVESSLFIGNLGDNSAAIRNTAGSLTLRNSTLTDNSATFTGGAIGNDNFGTPAELIVINSTIFGNTANNSTRIGGIVNNSATVIIRNSIVAGNTGDADIAGAFVSNGNNLIGNVGSASGLTNGVNGDIVGTSASPVDARLGQLADNGGPTSTHTPLLDSPVIDAGNSATAPAVDQRGVTRPVNVTGNIVFLDHDPLSTSADSAYAVHAADLDGDGDLDALSASQADHTIAWYENDGSGGFSAATILNTDAQSARDVQSADLDGDGDIDVLSASVSDNTLAWYRNDGNGGFGGELVISDTASGAYAAYPSDLDGDGDIDVLAALVNGNSIAWYANDGSGNFTEQTAVAGGVDNARDVHVADLDGDGDLDVLSASVGNDTIAWYENDGSQGFSAHTLNAAADGAHSVHAGDFDGDGDIDVLAASAFDDTVAWYRNLGSGSFSGELVISSSEDNVNSAHAADLDGDGDLDVLSASENDDTVTWFRNDGSGSFTAQTDLTTSADGANHVFAADLDGDGDLDVLSASLNDDKIDWYENSPVADIGAVELVLPPKFVSSTPANASHDVAADGDVCVSVDGGIDGSTLNDTSFVVQGSLSGRLIDSDGDITSLSAVGGTVTLNPAADFATGEVVQVTLTGAIEGPFTVGIESTVFAFRIGVEGGTGDFEDSGQSLGSGAHRHIDLGDLDGDGDIDAYLGRDGGADSVWLNDGNGTFSDSGQSLGTGRAFGVALGDLDADGDLDVFVANLDAANTVWTNNGSGTFSNSGQALGGSGNSLGTRLGDIDGDGDLDAVVASGEGQGNKVWINNGSGTFSDSGQSLGNSMSYDLELGDLDADGDLDLFIANNTNSGVPNKVWLNDGNGTFTDSGQSLGNGSTEYVELGDLDGDGDLDAFAVNRFSQSNRVWINDGSGTFSDSGQTLGTKQSNGVAIGDLDGDGDLDAAIGNRGEVNTTWINDGNGGFSDGGQSLGSGLTEAIAVADFDGDGDLDIFVADEGTDTVWMNLSYDFGDAPSPYPVTQSENGATHVTTGPTLGVTRDIESDGAHSAAADADGSDEDGVVDTGADLVVGQTGASVTVNVQNAPGGAKLDAWMDFNQDGDWDDSGEQILADSAVVDGDNALTFDIPVTASVGTTYARLRLSTAGGLGVTGSASDGEVEDHEVEILAQADFGDAPSPYPVTRSENGAEHIPTGPILGETRDKEVNGVHSAAADADGSDEDGVVDTGADLVVGQTGANVAVKIQDATGGAKLDAWMDFNQDGDWDDSGEQVIVSEAVANGYNVLMVDVPGW
ncbi:MAG: FG-GAP-like repeat-containing protein, partial [Planctomycetaceae bacterium]